MKQQEVKELLEAAGGMADRCRLLVGGKDLNGFRVQAADVNTISECVKLLREAVDKYDKLIMRGKK